MATVIIKLKADKLNSTTVILPTIFVEKAMNTGYTSICFAWLHNLFIIEVKQTKRIAADQENK